MLGNNKSYLNRFIGLLLVFIFIFTSCSPSTNGEFEPTIHDVSADLGIPKYTYLDENGKFSDTDTGSTFLYIDGNSYAKGVYVASDKYGSDYRVAIINENNESAIIMRFEEDSNFPYLMNIKSNNCIYYATISQYHNASGTYDIVFQYEDKVDRMYDLVLSPDILNLYKNNDTLSLDENLRLRNITIAMGLAGSISYYMEEALVEVNRSLKSFLKEAKNVFSNIALAGFIVACIGTAIYFFVNPEAGAFITGIGFIATAGSGLIIYGIDYLLETLEDEQLHTNTNNMVILNYYNEDVPSISGKIYHIPIEGDSLFLNFRIPYFDRESIIQFASIDPVYDYINIDSRVMIPRPINEDYITYEILLDGNNDEFQIKFTRLPSNKNNYYGIIMYEINIYFNLNNMKIIFCTDSNCQYCI